MTPQQNARYLKLCRKVALSTHMGPDSSLGPESLQSCILAQYHLHSCNTSYARPPFVGGGQRRTQLALGVTQAQVVPGKQCCMVETEANAQALDPTQPTGQQAHYMTNCKRALNSGNQAHRERLSSNGLLSEQF